MTGPLSVAQRLNLRLHRLFLLVLFLVAILGCFAPMLDHADLGWHVAQGRWMVHHLGFYRADVLNYPTFGHPVVDEYPLFQILLYVSTLPGWWGPCVLCALGYALLLSIFVLTGWALDLGPSATLALILGVMLVYLGIVFPLRPHLVTFLGIAAFGSFLLRHREAAVWTRFWPLALLQILWTNCHSGFVLGPLMVALFGLEMIVRRWLRNRAFPWTSVRIWSAATALVFLGCFANPWGVGRLGAPFYQEHLGAIHAYVEEMQPLNPGAAVLFHHLTLVALFLIAYVVFLRRGAFSWSFAFLALAFYFEALQVRKAWPIFAVFLPLLVLSSGAFARTTITRRRSLAWFSVAGHVAVLVPLVVELITLLDGHSATSLAVKWREWDAGRTELPVTATAWIKENHITGRLLHRCEDGGWLQENGVVPTWADTGFGKYDEAFIRENGLLSMNADLLPTFISIYQSDLVLCDGFAFQWPGYLNRLGWRLVFYSPNSSVWLRPGARLDLPTVTQAQVERAFLDDLSQHGLPRNPLLLGRDLATLHSLGDAAFAVQQLTSLPALHRTGWYWETARIMCFQDPAAPAGLREQLRKEADSLGGPSREFCACDDEARGDFEGAQKLLEAIPSDARTDSEARLLLQVEIALQRPDALDLARRDSLYSPTDGERWRSLAVLEDQAGNLAAADRAWRQTLYYAPELMPARNQFLAAHPGFPLGNFLAQNGWPPFHAPPTPSATHERCGR